MNESKILIVDDDPLTRTLLTGWMDHLQVPCLAVASIEEADAALAQELFDVLLSDVHLPGNQQLRWVQSVLARPQAPAVVLITGNPELESTLRAANLAIAGYLVKPLDLDALRALCQRLLYQRRKHRELIDLSRETEKLLSAAPTLDPTVREHLQRLSRNFSSTSLPDPRGNPAGDEHVWRDTLVEAIAVLEKTKHAFKSKDLGALRRRIEEALRQGRATA